jgi:hypothetical protein
MHPAPPSNSGYEDMFYWSQQQAHLSGETPKETTTVASLQAPCFETHADINAHENGER